MKVSELTGAKLDYWVAMSEGLDAVISPAGTRNIYVLEQDTCLVKLPAQEVHCTPFPPSRKWEHGGPIIDRERMEVRPLENDKWQSQHWGPYSFAIDETALVAAMRAYVASKFGDSVPD